MRFGRKIQQVGLLSLVCFGAAGCGSSMQALLGVQGAAALCEDTSDAELLTEEVIELVNEERELRGLNPLIKNDGLALFGARHACTMIEDEFFDHDDPVSGLSFDDRHATSDYRLCYLGENLAVGYDSAEEVVDAWMDSKTHRDNILDDEFIEIGLGIRQDSVDHQLYWVEVFLGECDQPQPASGQLIDHLPNRPNIPQGAVSSPTVELTTGSDDRAFE